MEARRGLRCVTTWMGPRHGPPGETRCLTSSSLSFLSASWFDGVKRMWMARPSESPIISPQSQWMTCCSNLSSSVAAQAPLRPDNSSHGISGSIPVFLLGLLRFCSFFVVVCVRVTPHMMDVQFVRLCNVSGVGRFIFPVSTASPLLCFESPSLVNGEAQSFREEPPREVTKTSCITACHMFGVDSDAKMDTLDCVFTPVEGSYLGDTMPFLRFLERPTPTCMTPTCASWRPINRTFPAALSLYWRRVTLRKCVFVQVLSTVTEVKGRHGVSDETFYKTCWPFGSTASSFFHVIVRECPSAPGFGVATFGGEAPVPKKCSRDKHPDTQRAQTKENAIQKHHFSYPPANRQGASLCPRLHGGDEAARDMHRSQRRGWSARRRPGMRREGCTASTCCEIREDMAHREERTRR